MNGAPDRDSMTNEEVKELVEHVVKMDDTQFLLLSNRQLDWLMDLDEHVKAGRFHKVSQNAINFLHDCKRGFYN